MSWTRRQLFSRLFRWLFKATGLAVVLGTVHALSRRRELDYPVLLGEKVSNPKSLIRPPGALEEAAFLSACIRCYRCQDACTVGAIQFFTERNGLHYHTPYIKPAAKACTLCMDCTQVCPTAALIPTPRKEKALVRMASVELFEDRCLSHKAKAIRAQQALLMELGRQPTEVVATTERRGVCGECYMFCPLRERAITLEPGSFLAPTVHEARCAGCGMCEEICRVMVRGEPAIRVVPTRVMA